MKPDHPALRELIQLGRDGREAIPSSLPDETAWHAFTDRSTPDTVTWYDIALALDADRLEHLIRGLVWYSRALNRPLTTGVLGTPVVQLFFVFASTYRNREAALGEWVVKHRIDPREPFGSVDNGTAYTYADRQRQKSLRVRAALSTTGS